MSIYWFCSQFENGITIAYLKRCGTLRWMRKDAKEKFDCEGCLCKSATYASFDFFSRIFFYKRS